MWFSTKYGRGYHLENTTPLPPGLRAKEDAVALKHPPDPRVEKPGHERAQFEAMAFQDRNHVVPKGLILIERQQRHFDLHAPDPREEPSGAGQHLFLIALRVDFQERRYRGVGKRMPDAVEPPYVDRFRADAPRLWSGRAVAVGMGRSELLAEFPAMLIVTSPSSSPMHMRGAAAHNESSAAAAASRACALGRGSNDKIPPREPASRIIFAWPPLLAPTSSTRSMLLAAIIRTSRSCGEVLHL